MPPGTAESNEREWGLKSADGKRQQFVEDDTVDGLVLTVRAGCGE